MTLDASLPQPVAATEASRRTTSRTRRTRGSIATFKYPWRAHALTPRPNPDERGRTAALPRRAEGRDRRDGRSERPSAPDAALVRAAARRDADRLDVREVAEGDEPRARPARDTSGRGRRRVPGAAWRDARVRRRHRDRHRARDRLRRVDLREVRTGRRRPAPARGPHDGREAGAEANRDALP